MRTFEPGQRLRVREAENSPFVRGQEVTCSAYDITIDSVRIEETKTWHSSNRFDPADVVRAGPEPGVITNPVTTLITASAYPDDNPKTILGTAKPSLGLVPNTALVHMAAAFEDGMKKYGRANWRDKAVTFSTYHNAALRHIAAYVDGENTDPVSGVDHLGHAAACLAIILDARACGKLNDDRPTPGPTAQLIRDMTKPAA